MAGWSDLFAVVAVDEYITVHCWCAGTGAGNVGGGEECGEGEGSIEAWE